MNLTAKKLREAANYMADSGANSAHAIATVRGLLDVVESDTFGGDLGRVLNVIADELDELQARAAEANCLRQQLESAEKKAERRKKQVEHTEDAIRERNARLKMRAELLEQAVNENRELRKQVPTECERQILDMWPKWSNGDYCMFGDLWTAQPYGEREPKQLTKLSILSPKLLEEWDQAQGENFAYEWNFLRPADTTYRPEKAEPSAHKVLDADGVEINVGDSMYVANDGDGPYIVCDIDENIDRIELFWHENRNEKLFIAANRLTHTRPDSWERLEEDAEFNDETGIVGGNLDIVRRAKALAGVEVD